MMLSLLALGFLIGMRHALEADHLAAVATLATRSHSLSDTIRQGAVWGVGHTLTLFVFGSVILLLDTVMPERLAHGLELAVGVMLIALGLDVLCRLIRQRIHFHIHRHDSGTTHFHAHAHSQNVLHDSDRHHHEHRREFPYRALFVGFMHGMAGSAALILLTLETVQTPLAGLLYIALFGLGSIAGMALLSVIIAIPLRYSARGLTWMHNALQGTVGFATFVLGVHLVYATGFAGAL